MASRSPLFRPASARPRVAAIIAATVTLGALLVAMPVTSAVAAQSPTACATPVTLTNGSFEEPFIGYGTYAVVNQGFVPGWSTTASDQAIEIWGTPFLGVSATNGTQIAELNANQVASLYQDVATTPGQVLRWSLDHRGRDGVDVMAVSLGAPGALSQQRVISDGQAWGTYSGLYTVPAGQTTTRFSFDSISSVGGGGVGNLLDNISLGNAACVVTSKSVVDIDGDGSVEVGDTLEYVVTAENRGGSPATSTIVTDVLPAGVSLVPGSLTTTSAQTDAAGDDAAELSGSTVTARLGDGATAVSGGAVPAGQSRSLTLRVIVDTAAAATTLRNEATTTYVESLSGGSATSVSNQTASVVLNAADLAVTQSLDAPLEAGATATYTITVANGGPHAALDSTLTTILPALDDLTTATADCAITSGILECDFGSLAVGASRTVVVSGTVPSDAIGGNPFTLTSTVDTSTTDTDASNSTATRSDAVPVDGAIAVTATITDATPSTTIAGESVTASYTVRNSGNVELTAVGISDPVFGAVSCAAAVLAPGDSTTCTADAPYVITENNAEAGAVTTTVTASGVTADDDTVTATATAAIDVDGTGELAVAQSLDAPLERGETASYTITVTNTGPQSAENATFTATAPGLENLEAAGCAGAGGALECDLGTLAVGETRTILVTGTVPGDALGGAPITLDSTVSTSTTDTTPANDTATRTDTVTSVAAIAVTATITDATPASTVAGERVTASYTVTNTGNVALTSVGVTDALFGEVTCAVTTLAAGESTECTADAPYVVTETDAEAGEISTTVTAQGTPPDGSDVLVVTSTVVASIAIDAAIVPVGDGPALTETGVDPTQPLQLALLLLLGGALIVVTTVGARRRTVRAL